MKSMKALIVIAALTVSSLAMAEGGAERTFARMEQVRSTEAYRVAQQQKAESPVAESKAKAADHADC
ncbi:MAG: co-regulatory protein PtrA N-terminal domain-containing protein [Pseudomonas sp.]